MPVKRVLDPETFDAVMGAHLEEATGATYVVFIGSEDPGTGESWCSDCVISTVISDPIIRGQEAAGMFLKRTARPDLYRSTFTPLPDRGPDRAHRRRLPCPLPYGFQEEEEYE